jgi:hypothetical protein
MKIALNTGGATSGNHHASANQSTAPSAASSVKNEGQIATAKRSTTTKTAKKKSGPNSISKRGKGGASADSLKLQQHSEIIQNIDRDTVMINGIEIDIEKITDEQLYSLRKILPRKDYRYVSFNVI